MKAKIFTLLFFVLIILSVIAYAHENEEENIEEETINIDSYFRETSIKYVLVSSVLLVLLVIFSIYYKEKTEIMRWILFLGIIIPIIATTAYLAGSTIYLNLISETKGPVHWHADYEIWNCREKIELKKPKGISNRIGSAVFHDHGDNRIHVEGVVNNKENVDLHNFFEIVGGDLDKGRLVIPTGQKTIEVKNGDLCNGEQGKLQVFVYKIINPDDKKDWIFEQKKVEDFPEYILSPYSQIPPGDCIIIEFSDEKIKTEHICETYKAAMERGDLEKVKSTPIKEAVNEAIDWQAPIDLVQCKVGETRTLLHGLGSRELVINGRDNDACILKYTNELEGGYTISECIIPISVVEITLSDLDVTKFCNEIDSGSLITRS